MGAVEEEIVVYLRGIERVSTVWYRVVLETSQELSKGVKRDREGQTISPSVKDIGTISPVAVIPVDVFGCNGGWAVIGDDIYWAGGQRMRRGEVTFGKELLKHNIHEDELTSWKKVSSLTIPRAGPFLLPLGRNLAIVAGTDHTDHMDDDNNWRNCGEVYDLDRQSFLEYITSDIKRFASYPSYLATTALEDPNQIAFYSLYQGSVLILDPSKAFVMENECEPLALCRESSLEGDDPLPTGLEGCESITPLAIAAANSRAVFHKRTFYWFTTEMMLYGYDMDLGKWFRSECLQQKLNPIKPEPGHKTTHTHLLGLPNGNFLVIFFQKHASPTMASIYVEKNSSTTTLDVNVDYIRHFHLSNPSVRPVDGIAIRLKNTGSGK